MGLGKRLISTDAAGPADGSAYFDTVIYTGDGGNKSISSLNFAPDFVWVKRRSTPAKGHILSNSISSNNTTNSLALLSTQNNEREYTGTETNGLYIRSLDSNGFTVGSSDFTGASGKNFVAWCWKSGGTPTATNSAGAGNVPTSGSVMIDGVASTSALAGNVQATKMSVNTASGFSIVNFTSAAGSTNQVPHGLGGTPDLFIFKRLDSSEDWWVYTQAIDGSLDYIRLNDNGVKIDSSETAPTSTTVYQPTSSASRNYILYSFKNIAGYQKIGIYNGSSSAVTVTTGFNPRWVLIKRTNATGQQKDWVLFDQARSGGNDMNDFLVPNTNATEFVNAGDTKINGLSDGFSVNAGMWDGVNASGGVYLYWAIA